MNQKCLGPRESTHQSEKPKIIFAYVILSYGCDSGYCFISHAHIEIACVLCVCVCVAWSPCNSMHLQIYSTYWSNGLCWWSRLSQNESQSESMVCVCFFFLAKTMFLSQAIVSDFRFPFISFHHQSQRLNKTKTKNARAERQQIPNLYLGFFSSVCWNFLRVWQFFYWLPRPISVCFFSRLVGWVVKYFSYMWIFFWWDDICACVFCQFGFC